MYGRVTSLVGWVTHGDHACIMIVGTACSDLHTLSCPVPGLSMDPEIYTMHNKCFEMHGVQILEH